jgi:alkaline phosphatase D
VLAEKQGMRTACFFWPGSEAEIDGMRPTYYVPFNDTFPDEDRIQQVLQWLQLPEADRPHFITLYYSNVDHAGHELALTVSK